MVQGSGKTHTMDGPPTDTARHAGVNRRAFEALFDEIARRRARGGVEITLTVSVFEVYNDRVFDLLTDVSVSPYLNSPAAFGTPGGGGGDVGTVQGA